ncbi:MAG: glycosyltransferase family 4 protein [Elusimicrobiaceae bacterium]|jgi:glycosyltransferase involved in cell wall biosynthesis|nr:glycosyltransferase family 4 protein [Elusimicrobiaceae bacterium]MBT3955427.1 glycosyltransferase family 4 protein [Elusimicrobiaceae bacterium]MBT4008771.1 glycosyltransferase family 4 protein [Elusimicrobiaceae bacterium]MBT5987892.1 glycosyltransferase family 4 protein [Elusimicrobiaceae bacterium]
MSQKQKSKILYIITKLELGGAQKLVLYSAENLDKSKFDTYLCAGKGGLLKSDIKDDKIFYAKNLVRQISPVRDIFAVFELAKIIKQIKPNIVHTNSSKAGILGRIACKFSGLKDTKVVHTFHGFGFNSKQFFLIRYFYIWIEKLFAHFADTLIFVSKDNMETAQKYKIGKRNKHKLIRVGIEFETVNINKSEKLKELGIKENAKIITSIGNFKLQKNPLHFVKIANEVLKKHPNTYFLFIGDGELRKKTEKLIKHFDISKNCKLLGWRKDGAEILSISHLYIMTSLWEGLPMTLVEAFNQHLPSICYGTDGVNDILTTGHNGFLVERKNWQQSARYISKVLEDENLYEHLKQNVEGMNLEEFKIENMLKQTEILYTDLIK